MRASLRAPAGPGLWFRWVAAQITGLSLALIWGKVQQRAVGSSLPQLGEPADGGPGDQPPQIDPIDPKALFAATVRASADMEMDWMWLYAQMTDTFERLYCLEKALALDPQNLAARRELALLVGEP